MTSSKAVNNTGEPPELYPVADLYDDPRYALLMRSPDPTDLYGSADLYECPTLQIAHMMIPVTSSAIRAVGYVGSTLAVLFHTSDTVYEHPGVPYSVYVGLMQADSMGAFYNRYIRGRYK